MCDLGNNKASYSWWWDSHHSSHQSQWLQNTLSDLDEKTKAMLILIQEDGDSFAQRAEMFYKKRSELIKLVEEFHRSYRSLAEQYDQLRSESSQLVQSGSSSSSNSFKQVQNIHNSTKEAFRRSADSKSETPNSHPDSVVEDPDFECNNYYFGHESPNKIADELSPSSDGKCKVILNSEVVNKNINDLELGQEMVKNFPMGSHERETMWAELRVQVSTLMEDNLRQQAELIRRNNEKRDVIKDLCSQLDRLMDENRALHDCLRCSNVGKQNQSQISKLKGLVLGKFLV